MRTYDVLASFWRDWRGLTPQQQRAFRRAVQTLIADLRGGTLLPALRVKRVQGHPGVWEMTRAADGRATFEYGDESRGRAARHLPADRHSRRLPAAVITALRRNQIGRASC